jgi:hypothetical protein
MIRPFMIHRSSRDHGDHQIPVMPIHLPVLNHRFMDPAVALYEIRINGHLGVTVLSAFPAMTSRRHGAHTVLTGLLDQSALYGALAQVEALGLDLLEVRRISPPAAGAEGRKLAW